MIRCVACLMLRRLIVVLAINFFMKDSLCGAINLIASSLRKYKSVFLPRLSNTICVFSSMLLCFVLFHFPSLGVLSCPESVSFFYYFPFSVWFSLR